MIKKILNKYIIIKQKYKKYINICKKKKKLKINKTLFNLQYIIEKSIRDKKNIEKENNFEKKLKFFSNTPTVHNYER